MNYEAIINEQENSIYRLSIEATTKALNMSLNSDSSFPVDVTDIFRDLPNPVFSALSCNKYIRNIGFVLYPETVDSITKIFIGKID